MSEITGVQRTYLEAIVRSMGCDPALIDQAGVTVSADPGRAESRVTAGYSVGEHFMVTCDPASEAMLSAATAGMAPSIDAWAQVAQAAGGELLGGARQYLLPQGLVPSAPLADGFTMRTLNNADADDLAKIQRLVDVSSESDLDYAELDMDALDDLIVGVLDFDAEIVSYASSMPFDMAPDFGDIAILTRPEHRAAGLGRAAVAELCAGIRRQGHEPLYRCETDNHGSVALCHALGFAWVTEVLGYRFC